MSLPELVTLALADAAHATRCGRCPRHHIARAVASIEWLIPEKRAAEEAIEARRRALLD